MIRTQSIECARRDSFAVPAVVVASTGVIALLLMTRQGIGATPDSAGYIRAARELFAEGHRQLIFTQYAPLYSVLLASGRLAGVDPLRTATWLNSVLFGLNIFIVGFLARRATSHARWLWLVAPCLMLSAPVLAIHATALSEPVFLLFALLGLYLLALHVEGDRPRYLVGSALCAALALLARYAGVACVVTGAVALLCFGAKGIGRRARAAVLFTAVAVLPMALLMLRNVALGGTTTGRSLAFHPIGRSNVWEAIYTVSGWLFVPASAPNVVRLGVLAIGVLVVLALTRLGLTAAASPWSVRFLALFVAGYAAFLAMSISFFDANTPLDDRILLPVFAAGVVIALHLVDRAWPRLSDTPVTAAATLLLVIGLLVGHVSTGARVAAEGYANGWGFTGVRWRQSATLARVKGLNPGTVVYSNAPEIVYLHTGLQPRPLPKTRFLMNGQPNRALLPELSAIERELRSTCGVVVYFRNLQQQAVPRENELMPALQLQVRVQEPDGVILTPLTCPR